MTETLQALALTIPISVFLAGAVWATVRASLRRLESKYDEMVKFCCGCKADLPLSFVSQATFQSEMVELQKEDEAQWRAINSHGHAGERVTR